MERVEIAKGVFQLRSGSNIGLIVQGDRALLVDAGLDKSAAREALRAAEELNVSIAAVFVTHAHADHYGGVAYLQRRLGIPAYAPGLEAAIAAHPLIEPIYLFSGAAPIQELRHKFTLAEPIQVRAVIASGPCQIEGFCVEAVALPGHAPDQMGLAIGETIFCADAIFPDETLTKHKVPFCVDMDQTLGTLDQLPEMPYARFAPGHGEALEAGEAIRRACTSNRQRLTRIRTCVFDHLCEPQDTASLLQSVAGDFALQITSATSYFLVRTTVLAAISSLEKAGTVQPLLSDNRLLWQRA